MGSKPGDLKFKTSNLLYRSWLRRSQIRGEESDNTPAFMLTLAESRPAEFFHRIWPELVAARPGLPGCHRTENRWSWKNWRACSSPSTPFDPSSWPWTLGLSPWPTTASPEGSSLSKSTNGELFDHLRWSWFDFDEEKKIFDSNFWRFVSFSTFQGKFCCDNSWLSTLNLF